MIKLFCGDALAVLRRMPADSAQCVVTSPPYWGLRDYGVSGQLGLEATPEEYLARMVTVFAEVRRVLRPDGVCWVNMGDSYAANFPGGLGRRVSIPGQRTGCAADIDSIEKPARSIPPGLRPKDVCGIPWRLALAMQADGWYLRADIIWHKPNPMPESVRDRPTKAHEYVFLLTKSARYFYDAEAVREDATYGGKVVTLGEKSLSRGQANGAGVKASGNGLTRTVTVAPGRNLRSVWTITPKPFPEAHFATFPPQLAERCIKAGTSERGACPHCGKPWERVIEVTRGKWTHAPGPNGRQVVPGHETSPTSCFRTGLVPRYKTVGFRPACDCPAADPVPCVVLDPFAGAGTVGLVCEELGRDHIGIELNPSYIRMARRRIAAARASTENSWQRKRSAQRSTPAATPR